MNLKYARLRKSHGPLSAGTRVEVLSYPPLDPKRSTKDKIVHHGYATIRLEAASHRLRAQVERSADWKHILGSWDIEADLLVFDRGTLKNAV